MKKIMISFWNGMRKMRRGPIHGAATAALAAALLGLAGCATTGSGSSASSGSAAIETALPLIRTGAAVATGAVLNFAVVQSSTRARLANEMYAAASAVYSLSGGTFPSAAQFQQTVLAFGGSQSDANFAEFASAVSGLYAAYYPQLAKGDAKTTSDLLNAIAEGIEDATQSYVTTPAAGSSVAATTP
jgi:hypothetical protein